MVATYRYSTKNVIVQSYESRVDAGHVVSAWLFTYCLKELFRNVGEVHQNLHPIS